MSIVTAFTPVGPLAQEFEDLFREHHSLVFRTADSVTGNAPDAEDVLQTIFLRILRREFPPALRKNPTGYLYRAAVNMSLNIIRSRRHGNAISRSEPIQILPAPDQAGIPDEMRKDLTNAMAKLKPRAVEILVLRYEHNYSDAQIAKMLGTSRGAVAVSLHRSRARLKKLLRAASGARR